MNDTIETLYPNLQESTAGDLEQEQSQEFSQSEHNSTYDGNMTNSNLSNASADVSYAAVLDCVMVQFVSCIFGLLNAVNQLHWSHCGAYVTLLLNSVQTCLHRNLTLKTKCPRDYSHDCCAWRGVEYKFG